MIDLGIGRVSRLLSLLGNPHTKAWKAIHVAGTNGKGSVCAYISSVLCEAKIPNGMFTSPHLIYKWDCIRINGKPVEKDVFYEVESHVQRINTGNQIGATEFEILTATAFEIFHRKKIRIGVVEVGLGGKLDATNVLPKETVVCSVITKIAMDHENFLGGTLAEIAAQKAGILKKDVACVVDGSNKPQVLDVIKATATDVGVSNLYIADEASVTLSSPLLGAYQKANLACALKAVSVVDNSMKGIGEFSLDEEVVAEGIKRIQWPGRLQYLNLYGKQVLIDGAHNEQSAKELRSFVESTVRKNKGITWILGFSKPKASIELIINALGVQPHDSIYAASFSDIDGMPWVKPSPADLIMSVASTKTKNTYDLAPLGLEEVVESAQGPVVICGSLYLVSEVLRTHQKI